MRAAKVIKRCLAFCFLAVSAAGLSGCGTTGAVAESEEGTVNYPEVWERVLPEELRTNIADYTTSSDIFKDYAASVIWELTEVHHVDGAEYDDVILRFVGGRGTLGPPRDAVVLYYSFFDDRLLSRSDQYKFSLTSGIGDVVPSDSAVRRLKFIGSGIGPWALKHYKQWEPFRLGNYIRPRRVTLSNGVIYDATSKSKSSGYDDIFLCDDPPETHQSQAGAAGLLEIFNLYKRGESFLPPGYTEEDAVLENTWLLLQRPEEPRYVSKECKGTVGTIIPVWLYNYYEYSFLRTDDRVVPLPDGTFLFVGTENSFPVFHIIRMHSDMSIPSALSGYYKWVSYKDYVGIVNLYEQGLLFSGRNKTCPLLDVSHPHCVEAGEDGSCARMKGGYLHYDKYSYGNLSDSPFSSDLAVQQGHNIHSCLNMGLRDYVRGDFEIHHCRKADKTVAGFTPCGDRTVE